LSELVRFHALDWFGLGSYPKTMPDLRCCRTTEFEQLLADNRIGADKASRLKADFDNLWQAVHRAHSRERELVERAKELNQSVQVS
jgi:hypothetical protein